MWLDFIKPNKKSVIATVITFALWLAMILFFFSRVLCSTKVWNPAYQCGTQWPAIVQTCGCSTASNFFSQLLGYIIVPLIIIYLFYSSLFIMRNKQQSK